MATPIWTYTFLGYLLFLSMVVFSEGRFPPPSGTDVDSRAPPRLVTAPPRLVTALGEPQPPDTESITLDFGSGKSTGRGLGGGQEGGVGISQGSSQGVVHPLFGSQGKMPSFSGVGSNGYGSRDGTQQITGPLVYKPVNCNSLSGLCDEIHINLESEFNNYGHQNKDIPHHEAAGAGHHQQMAVAPSYHH